MEGCYSAKTGGVFGVVLFWLRSRTRFGKAQLRPRGLIDQAGLASTYPAVLADGAGKFQKFGRPGHRHHTAPALAILLLPPSLIRAVCVWNRELSHLRIN